MASKPRVLVAGATGYLGKHLVRELKQQGYWIRALSRTEERVDEVREFIDDLFLGEVTSPGSLEEVCRGIDIVVSTIGITKQKDGLTYMDVDYQGNLNLLREAVSSQVDRFMYVSVLNADKLRHLEIVKAKEKFADELQTADLESIIIRPNGFFSDMEEFLNMAKAGRVWLFGNGAYLANPIHGSDLAAFCAEHMDALSGEFDVGGPEILTQDEIARLAFEVLGERARITHIPLGIRDLVLWLARTFTSSKTYGPLEFFMTVLAMDMVAPVYGRKTLKQHFGELSGKSPKPIKSPG